MDNWIMAAINGIMWGIVSALVGFYAPQDWQYWLLTFCGMISYFIGRGVK